MKAAVLFLSVCFFVNATRAEQAAEPPAAKDLLVVPSAEPRPSDSGGEPAVAQAVAESASAGTETPPAGEAGADVGEESGLSETPEDGFLPSPFPVSRYKELWERSPFQLESAAPPPPASASLAQRYALTGIAEISGEPIAFIMERATQQRLMVRKDGSGSGDLALVQIDVAPKKYGDSTVTLRQGAEVGVVKFDAGPAMPAPPMAQGMVPPQVQPGNPAMLVPPQPPQVPGQPGQMAGVPAQAAPGVVPPVPGPGIPNNGQVQQPGQPQMPPPRVIRRRAIVPAAP
jgi:hypothetical protein